MEKEYRICSYLQCNSECGRAVFLKSVIKESKYIRYSKDIAVEVYKQQKNKLPECIHQEKLQAAIEEFKQHFNL